MKKILGIMFILTISILISFNESSADWGPTQLEYLDADYPSHVDDPFSPGVIGTNQIQIWSNATFWEKLRVTYQYRSNAQPNWTSFQISTYSSTGYQTVNLWSGSTDVEFRVIFEKVDADSANTITVSWKYYTYE